ncbi:C6 zinc finger domain-containing protein [Nannizzia gypsea CBS 118893]|uniref:C6 zinc finger domain-containing protein n=1 Tax=Arthroderma gypseum (strain ATCC MYA-4604 / CBS 118893) TaxID=535722 RepID=E4USH4_ARTGP|nr:C6 zinc finger domain-containing protein [Nannizzia gypsea CBS 118893]EFR00541.1 C6 zinc finger domain-containing protein [Nannizzia gypsea CBS 118893]
MSDCYPAAPRTLEQRVKRIEERLGIPYEGILNAEDNSSLSASAAPFRQPVNEKDIPDARIEAEGIGFESAVTGQGEGRNDCEVVGRDEENMTSQIVDSLLQPERDNSQFLAGWPDTPGVAITCPQLQAFLPPYPRAVELVDYYQEHVGWAYHLLHMPTLRRHLLETYQQIGLGYIPNLPILALICAVFALSKFFSQSTSAFSASDTSQDKTHQEYVGMASQALAEARHLEHPTVESIQTVVLIGICLLVNAGAIRSARALSGAMYISAQALSLHQLDSPKNKSLRQQGQYNKLDLEIKRRLWWHIASTDWVYAFISGPQTGIYIVQPHQMHVDLPSNADDHEITPSSCPNKPLTEPTEVTYLILRCKASKMFVEFMETANKKGVGIHELEYDQILAFDKKINEFFAALPYFFQVETEGNEHFAELEKKRKALDKERPYIKWQRVMAQFGASTRISRLHRPYLALGARDPRYAYSRMACIRAARAVLEIDRRMRNSVGPSAPNPSKVWAIAYQLFLATTVLAMDYHFNRNEPSAGERAEEILECCRALDAAAQSSVVAARGLKKLKEVAAKWGLLSNFELNSIIGQDGKEAIPPPKESAHIQYTGYSQDGSGLQNAETGSLGAMWGSVWDLNINIDYSQWDGIFQDIESKHGML